MSGLFLSIDFHCHNFSWLDHNVILPLSPWTGKIDVRPLKPSLNFLNLK